MKSFCVYNVIMSKRNPSLYKILYYLCYTYKHFLNFAKFCLIIYKPIPYKSYTPIKFLIVDNSYLTNAHFRHHKFIMAITEELISGSFIKII